jgi:hypothetical protein
MLELATNPATDPDILRKLSRSNDRAIRQAVAENPNAPIETLWELIGDFPQEVTENPILDLLILDNPLWLLNVPQSSLVELFRAYNFCRAFSFLTISAANVSWNHNKHEWYEVLRAFMSIHPVSSTEHLEKIILMCGGIENFAKSTIFGHNPIAQANSLFDKLSIDTQCVIAKYSPHGKELATREDIVIVKDVLIALTQNKHTYVYSNLLANARINADLLTELTNHPDPRVHEFAEAHPNHPINCPVKYAPLKSALLIVKSALLRPKSMINHQYQLAANPKTAPEILRELSQSSYRGIRRAVAGNPNAPIKVLWQFMEYFPQEVMENPVILEDPHRNLYIPQSILTQLFRAYNFRRAFRFLEFFAANWYRHQDKWHDILHTFMSIHPISSAEHIEKIIVMCNGNIGRKNLEQLYSNSKTTSECLIKFSENGSCGICHHVLDVIEESRLVLSINLQAQEFLDLLSGHIMNNPNITSNAKHRLSELTNHPDPQVHEFAQQHPNTPK